MKIAKLGIRRDPKLIYYIKRGDVWASPRKGERGKAHRVVPCGIDLDYSRYIYFLDSDGDVSAKPRKNAGKK